MKARNYPNSTILSKFSAILFIILIANSFACKQEFPIEKRAMNTNEWWSPILQKQDITPSGFNNFEKVFEMGTTNSISDRIVTLENAFILIKPEGDEYTIIKSLKAYHDLDSNIIKAENGSMESYSLKSKDIYPIKSIWFDYLEYEVESKKAFATNVNAKVKIK